MEKSEQYNVIFIKSLMCCLSFFLKLFRIISEYFKCAVLCKGGHSVDNSDDLLYFDGKEKWYLEKRINNTNTHGTGCTLSSAITSNIAKGYSLEESIERAKKYISASLREMLNLGKGIGPLKHCFFDI